MKNKRLKRGTRVRITEDKVNYDAWIDTFSFVATKGSIATVLSRTEFLLAGKLIPPLPPQTNERESRSLEEIRQMRMDSFKYEVRRKKADGEIPIRFETIAPPDPGYSGGCFCVVGYVGEVRSIESRYLEVIEE